MLRYKFIPVILLLGVIVFAEPALGHIEGNLFVEHPPKRNAGFLFQFSRYEINNRSEGLLLAPFVEYALHPRFSIGVGIPFGEFRDTFQISDAVIALKSSLPLTGFTVIPVASIELPTGQEPLTSQHAEVVPAVFMEKKIPDIHLYSLVRGRFALKESHDHEEINVLTPHTENELDGKIGVSYWLTDVLGIDARVNGYYENLRSFHSGIEVGAVFQMTTRQDITIKASIGYYTTSSGIREGNGIGFSFFIAL